MLAEEEQAGPAAAQRPREAESGAERVPTAALREQRDQRDSQDTGHGQKLLRNGRQRVEGEEHNSQTTLGMS